MKHLLEGFWVDPLVKTAEGETPLMTFIRDGKREQAFAYLNYLKEAGIPYNQKDIYGKTALDIANSYGDRELVSALAATENDDTSQAQKAHEKSTTLHEQKGLFEGALSWFGQDKKDKPATTQEKVDDENVCIKNALEEYLSLSSLSEAYDYLETLPKSITKEALAKESAKGDKYTGLTCLHRVTNSEKVKFLLLLDANFNVFSKEGQNPLHYMIKTGSFDTAIMLLDRFNIMNFDIRDHRGMTPLGYAIIAKHDALIKKLLEKGSDLFKITTINDSKVCPLELFLDPRFYKVELVSSLFSPSVLTKINVKNKMKLLIVALENHYEEVKNILLGNDTFETLNLNGMNFAMYLAKSTKYHDVLEKFVLPQMKNITASDGAGNSIMHYAVKKCNFSKKEKMIKAIISFMPSLAHQNNKGETPLHVALMNKEFNIDLLLNHDVSALNVKDHRGYTPLHIALIRRDEANVLTFRTYAKC